MKIYENDVMKKIGIIGLGKMGGNIALQALEKNIDVIGMNKDDVPEHLTKEGVVPAKSIEELKEKLPSPRIIFLYVPAGSIVDKLLENLFSHLEPGDIIIDGGNSYWGDSIRRAEKAKEKGIHFLDCGTSGGIRGARNGACFMVGGDKKAYDFTAEILEKLAIDGGCVYTGPSGTGHYVKLVHNGIEFGMLQAIGEGMQMLKGYREDLPVQDILSNWNHGSVIRSWLIELMGEQYAHEGNFDNIPDFIEDTGEVNWLVDDAMKIEIPIPVISQSVMQLIASRDRSKTSSRAVAMMRHGFGEHPFGEDENIAKERHEGRIGQFVKSDK